MKKLLLLMLLPSIALALDPPNLLYNYKGELNKLNLISTVQDTYVRLGNTVNTSGAQTISGDKTFTGSVTIASATVGSLNFNDGTNQNTAYNSIKYSTTSLDNTGLAFFSTTFATVTIPTDMFVNLPSAGTYMIYVVLRIYHAGTANNFGVVQLWNSTENTIVPNSIMEVIEVAQTTQGVIVVPATGLWQIVVTKPTKIVLQAQCTTATLVAFITDANGRNRMGYWKQ
jgi:hypothetical protein